MQEDQSIVSPCPQTIIGNIDFHWYAVWLNGTWDYTSNREFVEEVAYVMLGLQN